LNPSRGRSLQHSKTPIIRWSFLIKSYPHRTRRNRRIIKWYSSGWKTNRIKIKVKVAKCKRCENVNKPGMTINHSVSCSSKLQQFGPWQQPPLKKSPAPFSERGVIRPPPPSILAAAILVCFTRKLTFG